MNGKKGIKLQIIISSLVTLAILLTISVNWYSSAQALRDTLSTNYLESNQKYARKLALSTSDMLTHMQKNVHALARILTHDNFHQIDIDEWRAANEKYFSSLFITDENGVIQFISPSINQNIETEATGTTLLTGIQIQSKIFQKALTIQKPFISEPYRAAFGELIVLVSAPIFNQEGVFQGLVAGAIHLESDNVINSLLNHHDREVADGSYVFVVDQRGAIIYHPNSSRINHEVTSNQMVQKVIKGKSGSQIIINSEGKEFFAGYAYEENSGWGIVSQTPLSVIEAPLKELLGKVILQSLPLLCLILVIAWYLTNSFTKPINKLAEYAENAANFPKASVPPIKSNIYEVSQLYNHLQNHLKELNIQVQLDGLTELGNRRAFDATTHEWFQQKIPFSIIMIDIDHFKEVNDTYGHLTGDDLLKFIASMMRANTSEDHLFYRYGGEEFSILLKNSNEEGAFITAEQLRMRIANSSNPTGESITVSLGISSFHPKSDQSPEEILIRADKALYQSKLNGKNRTTIYRYN
ncbi:sensor domain-containing diguanylate cyclase [Bacillus tuaregi]|uniref:sensor domain-containing diguanylate cyclase n=1 Tax=Bacillus tuaregi TaxID=1816695 RepID=UPI0008F8761F|nr:sensor domain-containing diguanylate cyclase [Bacillus tuaregi]